MTEPSAGKPLESVHQDIHDADKQSGGGDLRPLEKNLQDENVIVGPKVPDDEEKKS
jgi:hypothetical protein